VDQMWSNERDDPDQQASELAGGPSFGTVLFAPR
jgi:hypothetical protein